MLDAFHLADQLQNVIEQQMLKEYEKEMVPRGLEAVQYALNAFPKVAESE